ncbi:hypothetical protein DRQ09_08925 [candidate division KSB1 bacterium]|nr:MAG: hypothetical protein DRQ09_08925 [candidate division KSB1 bacterium]
MVNIIIGAITMAGFLLFVNYFYKKGIRLSWWEWVLTISEFIFILFLFSVIYGFLAEGAIRAALVNGVILGMIVIVWGVILVRFILSRSKLSKNI